MLYGKYSAQYLKRDVGGSAKTLEIYKLHEEYDVNFIKLGRLGWAGHVMKMEGSDTAKKVPCTEAGVNGGRKTGRPKLRWCDELEEEVTQVGCRNWGINVQSREKWQKLTEEVKSHSEQQNQYIRWRRSRRSSRRKRRRKKNCNAA
jgi:hypothetical protein